MTALPLPALSFPESLPPPVIAPPLESIPLPAATARAAVERSTGNSGQSKGWTDQKVADLTRLWSDGWSASQIAAELGDGFTRNAVIGKVHRLGLSGTAPRVRPARARSANNKPKPRRYKPRVRSDGTMVASFQAAPVPEVIMPPDSKFLCTLDDLGPMQASKDNEGGVKCRSPIGDPGTSDFRYCGTPGATMPGPYCAFHRNIYYKAGSASGSGRRVRSPGDRNRLSVPDYTERDGAGVPPLVRDDAHG